jgi:hypothetical protein
MKYQRMMITRSQNGVTFLVERSLKVYFPRSIGKRHIILAVYAQLICITSLRIGRASEVRKMPKMKQL